MHSKWCGRMSNNEEDSMPRTLLVKSSRQTQQASKHHARIPFSVQSLFLISHATPWDRQELQLRHVFVVSTSAEIMQT